MWNSHLGSKMNLFPSSNNGGLGFSRFFPISIVKSLKYDVEQLFWMVQWLSPGATEYIFVEICLNIKTYVPALKDHGEKGISQKNVQSSVQYHFTYPYKISQK